MSQQVDSPLIIIETEQEVIVAWDDDPEDWIARFRKDGEFPAYYWASRMQSLYTEQVQAGLD